MASTQRNYREYQYETSPRKLKPEEPHRKPYKPKKTSTISEKSKREEEKKNIIEQRKKKAKIVVYLVVAFGIIYAMGYRNSQINEAFSKKQSQEKEISQIKKENEQLEVNIQNSLNLNQIEALAKERLGMQKLTNKQTIYIDLPKKDYVEAGVEEVKIDEEKTNFIDGIIEYVKNIFK